MKSDRPVNLDIFTMNLPFAAWASIAHRITGGILFVGLVFGLYALQLALSSAQGFAEAVTLSDTVLGRIIFTGLVFSFSYHLLAGIKHLLLDFHIGDFHWFIFNIADVFISIGVLCLIFVEIFMKNINK